MKTETPISWRTRPSELAPDPEPDPPCPFCRQADCWWGCEVPRERAAKLERERLERLAERRRSA